MYKKFANFYDRINSNNFYRNYANFVMEIVKNNGINNIKLLDVACGTGRMIERLKKDCVIIEGADFSKEMLKIAKKRNKEIKYYNQSYTKLDTGKKYNIIISTFDSINYLTSKKDITQAFKKIAKHLMPEGLFIFDFNTIYKKINSEFINNGVVFKNIIKDKKWISNIQVRNKKNIINELHRERLYSFIEIKSIIEESGMKIDSVYSDFNKKIRRVGREQRLYIVAKNKQ